MRNNYFIKASEMKLRLYMNLDYLAALGYLLHIFFFFISHLTARTSWPPCIIILNHSIDYKFLKEN